MANTVLVNAESSAAALAGGHTATAVQHIAKSNFLHVSNGNYEDTRKAIEAYFKSRGVPPHTHTAELIMVMERSFKGKYMKGERSHYQQIMPSASWRKNDIFGKKRATSKLEAQPIKKLIKFSMQFLQTIG